MRFENFTPFRVLANGVDLYGVKGGSGPPLLLLHGHPHDHRVWHRCAARLAARFTVIAPDLRGHGESAMSRVDASDEPYSKRTLADDLIVVMRRFSFDRFPVCAHDLGAHVAHRMALDYPDAIDRLMLLDIVPAVLMVGHTSREFAAIDFEHDRTDLERGNRIGCPVRVLWGTHGEIGRGFEPLAEWRKLARDVSGRALPCGHAIPEEAPDALMVDMMSFFEELPEGSGDDSDSEY